MAKFTNNTTLPVHGSKEKFDKQSNLTDTEAYKQVSGFVNAFINLVHNKWMSKTTNREYTVESVA